MRYYPTRNDLDQPDKVERVVKDIYDKLYKPTVTSASSSKAKRIDINSGKVITTKK